ncbi:preprotein translocase subunit SecG [bacterium]|nr:MAG: preprotein translocase subunit SecG [bacterium]
MFTLLMTLFIFSSLLLAILILIQQGKGDMGMGSLGGSTQMLFGGSGGQNFFEKATWILGAIFLFGSLGLTVLKAKTTRESGLKGFVSKKLASREVAQETKSLDMDLATDRKDTV